MRDLNDIRRDINAADNQLRELFLRRMALALEVAENKARSGGKVFQPGREAEILQSRAEGLEGGLRRKYVSLLEAVIRKSRECQYAELLSRFPERFPFAPETAARPVRTVFYQGVEGAYAHQAARALFPGAVHESLPTWDEVFRRVHAGEADMGVVPVENSTAGTVNEVYDLMLGYDLFINRSYIQPVVHCLAAPPGATLASVSCVCSHPHALPQCDGFIKSHGYCTRTEPNTAVAAEKVAAAGDRSLAAICSREAAERNGLSVLAEGVNDVGCNETRFIAVSARLTALPGDDRVEICFSLPNQAGSLNSVLSALADYGIDMTEIHSRPIKDSPWCYIFYVDFTGSLLDDDVRALLYQLHEELPYLKVLGSYRARPTEGAL